MDPEELALRRGVCAEPKDDTARLVLADWLSDHGREPLAEFVRLQVRLAFVRPDPYKCKRCFNDRYGGLIDPAADPDCGWHEGVSREAYLLRNHWDDWLPWKPAGGYLFALDGPTVELGSNHSRWTFRRGFVAELSCSAEFFLAHADVLVWHPEKCPKCLGAGSHALNPYELANRHGTHRAGQILDATKCTTCAGTGDATKPFPAAAHPVEKVALTTFPDAEVGRFNALRPWKKPLEWGGDTRDVFKAEWPWLEFGWPQAQHLSGMEPPVTGYG